MTAIVLAAGASRRFGMPKQLYVYRGETLLSRAIRVANEAGCTRVVAVVRPGELVTDADVVENDHASDGLSTSLRVGVAAAHGERVLVTLCDQPLITAEHLRALIETDSPIAATAYRDVVGVPAVFDARFTFELMTLDGDRGARSVIDAHRDEVVAIAFEPAGIDVDTPQDAATLEA